MRETKGREGDQRLMLEFGGAGEGLATQDKMMTGCRVSYPAMSRHPTTDAGMWGTGRKGLAAQYRMMPGCRVSYPALSRDPTTDADTRRAGGG